MQKLIVEEGQFARDADDDVQVEHRVAPVVRDEEDVARDLAAVERAVVPVAEVARRGRAAVDRGRRGPEPPQLLAEREACPSKC